MDAKKQSQLEDLLNRYKSQINNNEYICLYVDDVTGEEELEPYITELLYNNNIDPFSDKKMKLVPSFFAYNLNDVNALNDISNKTLGKAVLICSRAFSNCGSVINIDYTGNIDEAAFESCTNLKSVKLGYDTTVFSDDDLYKIDKEAFIGCTSLESVDIGPKVERICRYCFAGCSNLKSVNFGNRNDVLFLGDDAFIYCKNLKSITLTDKIVVTYDTFNDCGIEVVNVPKDYSYKNYINFQSKNIKIVEY